MDILATQPFVDHDTSQTQELSSQTQNKSLYKTELIGSLNVNSKSYPVKKGINKIGRIRACDILLNDQTVSKCHAEIEAISREASAWICDLNSFNKTKLNNAFLRPGRYYELRDGSVLQFGLVRAIYKIHPAVDESLIPETPALSRSNDKQRVIPDTPNSSVNMTDSSALEEDSSIIPATQTNNKETFQRPSTPRRKLTASNRKSSAHDSSANTSVDSTTKEQKNVCEEKISIHDMETQNPCQLQDVTHDDIHDLETQTFCLNNATGIVDKPVLAQTNDIHDIETQKEEDMDDVSDGTRDKNASREIEIQNTRATKIQTKMGTDTRNVTTDGDSRDETLQTAWKDSTKIVENGEMNSQEFLQLSVTTNFEEETSVLDMSRDLLGSQNLANLIEDDDDAIAPDEKSTDDENLHDAATQINMHDVDASKDDDECVQGIKSKASPGSDDSYKPEFQSYSCIKSKDIKKKLNNQFSDSDSDTDEEGKFEALARQERQSISNSFGNASRNSSKDSEDMFNMLTQQACSKSKESFTRKSDDGDKDDVCDTPTQKIETNEPESDATKGKTRKVYRMLLQILPSDKQRSNVGDVTEMDDDIATQLLVTSEENCNNDNTTTSPVDKSNPVVTENCNVEDNDYETAPTQLISEVEKRSSRVSDKANLDDSIEKNMKAMFDAVAAEPVEDPQSVSTQVLTDMLQSSQCEFRVQNNNSESNQDDETQMSTKKKKSKTANINSKQVTTKKSRVSSVTDTNTDGESQNSESYFSTITSKRKRHVLVDSQHDTEQTSSDKTEKENSNDESKAVNITEDKIVSSTPLRSKSKDSPTRRSRRNEQRESTSTNLKDSLDTSSKPDDVVPPETSDDSKQPESVNTSENEEEEDIMAGLPEFKIAGTLSNPSSPTSSCTSSMYKINTYATKSKSAPKNVAPKKRGAPRKWPRKTLGRVKTDAPDSSDAESSRPRKQNEDTVDQEHDTFKNLPRGVAEETNEKSTRSTRNARSGNSREPNAIKHDRSYQRDSVRESRSLPPINHVKERTTTKSPFVQENGRTRGSSKEYVDRSSVFQVDKEILAETKKSMKQNTRVSRNGKRSLNETNALENYEPKKSRADDDVDEDIQKSRKGRKSDDTKVNGRRSTNISNYVSINGDGTGTSKSPFNDLIDKQVVISISKLSPWFGESKSQNTASGESTSNAETEQGTKRKGRKKRKATAEDISTEVGEESQEVEMIMNGSLVEQNSKPSKSTPSNMDKDSSTSRKVKNSKKRTNAKYHGDSDHDESTASSVHESDDSQFEMPTSKAKRAKISNNFSNLNDTLIEKDDGKMTKNVRRSVRAQKQRESSVEEHSGINDNQNLLDETVTSTKNFKRGGLRTRKLDAYKEQDESIQDKSISSDTSSSIDATIASTPNRTRSMSVLSSSIRSKHKVAFTGILNNNYTGILKKLGASLVDNVTVCTVLVTDKVRRTVKFLSALSRAVPIVSIDWLIKSEEAGRFLELEDYILEDVAAESQYGFKLKTSLQKAEKHKLLDDYNIVLTPNVAPPPLPDLKTIIASCGGKVLLRPPRSWPKKAVIISREEDMSNAKKFQAKAPKSVTIQSTEFLLTGILKQELDFTKYKLT